MRIVRFGDNSRKPITNVRATYRLAPTGDANIYRHPQVTAEYGTAIGPKQWRVELDRYPVFLSHCPETHDYAIGATPHSRNTAYILRKDGDALVLELWDVEPTAPGEWHLPGVDGP